MVILTGLKTSENVAQTRPYNLERLMTMVNLGFFNVNIALQMKQTIRGDYKTFETLINNEINQMRFSPITVRGSPWYSPYC